MAYELDALTSDCYEGTTCLINKLDIHDEKQLAAIEADITFAKASALEQNPMDGDFDFRHYKAIHKYLFEDLYDWAGQICTVDIAKKGTIFVKAEDIDSLAAACFRRLKEKRYFADLDVADFIPNIVDFYCVTNMLHPFREGNGRTQRVFIAQLIRHAGYNINFSDIDPDELMIATIQSANGVRDGLLRIFAQNIVCERD